jgi:mRNA interferase MazF
VLIVQDDQLDRSKVNSVLVIPLTTNLDRSKYPYSVLLPRVKTGLARESVAMTLQLSVIFKIDLDRQLGHVPDDLMEEIDIAMMTVLGLMP